jgi:hypothetical protein
MIYSYKTSCYFKRLSGPCDYWFFHSEQQALNPYHSILKLKDLLIDP